MIRKCDDCDLITTKPKCPRCGFSSVQGHAPKPTEKARRKIAEIDRKRRK